ncbi:MAG: DNA primase [Oscillospiraceae bacterium]|nr:DNA primase [Oscillospiraceae bacterium]
MAFSESFLDELIARNDIVDVVGSYVQLTKRSGSNQFGLCPFHNEKTPSFSVSSDKQIYHCFGCGKGGGVINFIMEIEGLSFRDAVEFLAKRSGMQMPEDDVPPEQRGRRQRLLELNKDAARFFYENLSRPEGQAALEYINRRGISKAMVKRFGLGYALDGWHNLIEAMTLKGYSKRDLLEAGLAKEKKGSVYDVFRNRLMFPVIDIRGSVVAFSGRIIGEGEPKYLNSPDTPVFSKSRNLFALNLAKKSKAGMLILAEGNVDVVSLHQAGFDCAVASLGTALTREQVKLMERYTENVVLAYDADAAGVKAAQRAISLFENTGINVKVLKIPDGKDPDEFIKKHGSDSFRVLLEQSDNHIDYRIMAIMGKYDLNTDEGKIGFLHEATQMLSGLNSSIEREVYGAKVAQYAGVTPEAVKLEVGKAFKRRLRQEKRQAERSEMRVENTYQPDDQSIRYKNVRSAAAEEGVIRLLLLDGGLIRSVGDLKGSEFSAPFLGAVFDKICEKLRAHETVTVSSLAAQLEPAQASRLSVIIGKPEVLSEAEKSMADYIDKIRTEQIRSRGEQDLLAISKKYRQTKGYGEHNG